MREHLLPRLFGFELLMAPYAICHLKLAMEIGGDDGAFSLPAGERLNVFLTNSLEEAHEAISQPLFGAEIAREAREADAVKRDHPVMVVIGNPSLLRPLRQQGQVDPRSAAWARRGLRA